MLVATLLLPLTLTTAAVTQPGGSPATPNATGVRAVVSRQELRVVFPPDSASTWGWSGPTGLAYRTRYSWSVAIEGLDGPRRLEMIVSRDKPKPRRFTSLASLVAAANSSFCPPGHVGYCPTPAASLSASGRQVVMTYADPITIARLFALRPRTVTVSRWSPTDSLALQDSVTVEYVEPEIPQPNAETFAEAVRARRAYEASTRRITRYIDGGPESLGPLWLPLGDSALQMVAELRCHTDVCVGHTFDSDVTWSIDDSTVTATRIVTPRSVDADSSVVIVGPSRASALMITARRLGRTTLRAQLAAAASDTMPSRTPPSRAVERAVHIIPPVARVELTLASSIVRAGVAVDLRARAFDESGSRIAGAPIEVEVVGDSRKTADPDGRVRHTFAAGTSTIIARFFRRADTLVVSVDK